MTLGIFPLEFFGTRNNSVASSGDVSAGDGLAQAFRQAFQMRHAFPEFSDQGIHMFAKVSNLTAQFLHVPRARELHSA